MTHERGRPPHPELLTPAEQRVLKELQAGRRNAEIADQLGISINTVRYHVSNILGKLDQPNRVALRDLSDQATPSRSRLGIAWLGFGREGSGVGALIASVTAAVAVAGLLVVANGGTGVPLLIDDDAVSVTPSPDPENEPLLTRAAFEVSVDGTPVAVQTFEEIQAVTPFVIALPSAPPAGFYLSMVQTSSQSGSGDDVQGALLRFTTDDGTDNITVVQVNARIGLPFPPTFVDIDGVEGHRIPLNLRASQPAQRRLSWRSCGRTFLVDYPIEILSDDAAIDLAAALTDSCVDRADNPEDPDLSFDRDAPVARLEHFELQIHTDDGPTTVESFEEIESLTPFAIALPPAFPAGTVLRTVSVSLGPEGINEETRRRVTTVSLIFSSMNGSSGFTVEQLLDERQQGDPTTPVDIRGVEGQLFTNDNGNVLSWRACDRTFTMAYPHDYLDDKAVIAFAAALIAACE